MHPEGLGFESPSVHTKFLARLNFLKTLAGEAGKSGLREFPTYAKVSVGGDSPQVHTFGYVNLSVSPLRGSAAKLNGNLKEKINFWFFLVKENFLYLF